MNYPGFKWKVIFLNWLILLTQLKGEVAYFYADTAKECARILEQAAHSGQSADFKSMTEAVEMAVRDLMNNLMETKNSKNHVK